MNFLNIFFRSLFIFSIFFSAGCYSRLPYLSSNVIDQDLSIYYEKFDHLEGEIFLKESIDYSIMKYGDHKIKLKKIYLYQSKKRTEFSHLLLKENFSLVEVRSNQFEYANIYIGVDINHPSYYPLIAHESFHLLNPYINDWYMEGMASVFAEEFCLLKGIDAEKWVDYFNNKPYQQSFYMMKKLKNKLSEDYKSLIYYVKKNDENDIWSQIDINKWIKSLSKENQLLAYEIIQPYTKILKQYSTPDIKFMSPVIVHP